MGTDASFRVRWTGWSSSWFVFDRNTDDSRSKVIFPSGLGYSIGLAWSLREICLWSGSWPKVHGTPRPIWCSRSEEHTSELQSLMRISYAVFCLKKKTETKHKRNKKRLNTKKSQ